MDPPAPETSTPEPPTDPDKAWELLARIDEWVERVEPVAISYWRRGFGFFGPIALFFLPLVPLAVLRPNLLDDTWTFYPLAAIFGVDVAVSVGVTRPLTWWYIALWTMWGQMMLGAFLLWNVRFLRRVRRIDAYFAKRERKAVQMYQRRAWMRKFHFWGLCAFTVLPVGSGIYVGVLIGKYTGLADFKTWSALMIGTAAWLAFLAYALTHAYDFLVPHVDFPWEA